MTITTRATKGSELTWAEMDNNFLDLKNRKLNVKDFGAVGNGSTDDTAAITAALAALPSAGGVLYFPAGVYPVSSPITIGDGAYLSVSTNQNIRLVGDGTTSPPSYTPGQSKPFTQIKYTGTANAGYLLTLAGPLYGCAIEGMEFNCNSLIDNGIKLMHVTDSHFEDILVYGHAAKGIKIDNHPQAWLQDGSEPGCYTGSNDCTMRRVRCTEGKSASAYIGISIGADALSGTPPVGLVGIDVARWTFEMCTFWYKPSTAGSYGVELRATDNLIFQFCIAQPADSGSSGKALYINPPTGTGGAAFPFEITFFHCPFFGDLGVNGTWTPGRALSFIPLPTGDAATIPTNGNIVGISTDIPPKTFGSWGKTTAIGRARPVGDYTGGSSFRVVALDTADTDINTGFSAADDRFTPTVAGYYLCCGTLLWGSVPVDGSISTLIYKNGNRVHDGDTIQNNAGAAASIGQTVSAIVYLNGSTDYVQLACYSSVAANIIASNSYQTYFHITKLD